jgi:hypothetical protein
MSDQIWGTLDSGSCQRCPCTSHTGLCRIVSTMKSLYQQDWVGRALHKPYGVEVWGVSETSNCNSARTDTPKCGLRQLEHGCIYPTKDGGGK